MPWLVTLLKRNNSCQGEIHNNKEGIYVEHSFSEFSHGYHVLSRDARSVTLSFELPSSLSERPTSNDKLLK